MVVCSSSYGLRLLQSSHSAYVVASTKACTATSACRLPRSACSTCPIGIAVSTWWSEIPAKKGSSTPAESSWSSLTKFPAGAGVRLQERHVTRRVHCKVARSPSLRKGSQLLAADCLGISTGGLRWGSRGRECCLSSKSIGAPRRARTTSKADSRMEAQVLTAKETEVKEPAREGGAASTSDKQSSRAQGDLRKIQESEQTVTGDNVPTSNTHNKGDLTTITVGGLSIQGVSVGGQETCIIIPSMKIAFDIGRCPQRAVFQENVLISHAHMDHIGGICLQAATRGLFSMTPPRIVVPKVIVPAVENLFNAFRALDNAELEHKLIGLEVGEQLGLNGSLFVKPFQTYHVVPSQGYVVYSRRQKLKKEFVGMSGQEIGRLRKSGVEVTDVEDVPEVAFTGDTTAKFITDPANADVLRAKLLIMEMTFIDDSSTVEHARKYGHTHLDEVVPLAHLFQNEAILFIHFSARYRRRDILEAIDGLPPELKAKVTPLLERF